MTRTILAIAAAALVAAGPVAAEPTTVKFGTNMPPVGDFAKKVVAPWLRSVEADSQGTVKFHEFWGASLIRDPGKYYEGIMNGLQDASIILPSYSQALFPDFSIFALPTLFRGTGSGEASVAGWKMHEKGLLGGVDKLYVASFFTNDNGGMHFNRSFKTLDEAKGMKIRTAGPEEADVIQAIGAVPVAMSINVVSESLNRGVIDGTMNGWSALNTFKITPLIKTHIDAGFGVRSFFIAVGRKAFDALPEAGRKAFEKNGGLELSRRIGAYYDTEGGKVRNDVVAQGHTVIRPEGAELERLEAKFKPFHEAWIKEQPGREAKYKALMQILAEIRGKAGKS
jgi:TRAP-type C4-dicarboxylate transport system substrate-binding protein